MPDRILVFCGWCGIATIKTDVFASNGLLRWWVPTILVAPWYVLMGAYLIKAGRAGARGSQDRMDTRRERQT